MAIYEKMLYFSSCFKVYGQLKMNLTSQIMLDMFQTNQFS